jgi:hypothetical protein
MKGICTFLVHFFIGSNTDKIVNMPLLFITLIILLTALWICIKISRKNRLYIHPKKDDKDNAFT